MCRDRDLSLQKGISQIYTLRLDYSKISILGEKKLLFLVWLYQCCSMAISLLIQ